MKVTHKELLPCPFCGKSVALSYCGSSDWEVFHPNDDDLDCVTMTIQCVRATTKQWDEDEGAEYNLAATRWNERKYKP